MSSTNKVNSSISISERINHEHPSANPSFHDTPEDAKNYKSLQNKPTIKKSIFTLKPSLLTQKAEQLRTDKAAVSATNNISTPSNKFLVLGDNTKDLSPASNTNLPLDKKKPNESSGFVFGENIFSRVVDSSSSKPSDEESAKEFKDLVCTNSSVESTTDDADNDALRKSADELSQKQITQQYDETEVITGEEEETTALKALCKLFLFNPEKNEWVEKGFCNVHLNDMTEDGLDAKVKSRLIIRSKGGLKVLVNTLLWSEMGLARASTKAVRISAQSEDGVKSFLLTMQNATDADLVFFALQKRKTRLTREATAVGARGNASHRKREIVDSDDSEDAGVDPSKKRHCGASDNGNTDEGSSDCC